MDSSSMDRHAPQPQTQRQQLQQHLTEGGNPNLNLNSNSNSNSISISNPGGAAAEATNLGALSFSSSLSFISHDEDMSRVSALNAFKLKEEEIEKHKLEIREKVMSHLSRVEEETKRLATIREELETLSDPMGKEVALVRKRIDAVNKELKPLGHLCQKKEKEYKETLDAVNEKNKEKVQLINKLMELSSESEKVRMKRLEELSMTIQ